MATNKQKQAIKNFKAKPTESIGKIMRKSGYSDITSKTPALLTNSIAWNEFLETVDDDSILKRIEDFAMHDDDKTLALNSAKEIFKLKNRYPTGNAETITPQLNILVKELRVEGGGGSNQLIKDD